MQRQARLDLQQQKLFLRKLRLARRICKRPKGRTTPGFFNSRHLLKRAQHESRKRRKRGLEQDRLLILDIDNTLVHCMTASMRPIDAPPPDHLLLFADVPEPVHLFKRPGLDAFLASLEATPANELRVGVWTAGGRQYATKVLNAIWPAWRERCLFLAARSECTWISRSSCVKELGLLPCGEGTRPYNVLLIDDNPGTARINTAKGYAVWKIAPFEAELLTLQRLLGVTDSELAKVERYIQHVLVNDQRFERRPKKRLAAYKALPAL